MKELAIAIILGTAIVFGGRSVGPHHGTCTVSSASQNTDTGEPTAKVYSYTSTTRYVGLCTGTLQPGS